MNRKYYPTTLEAIHLLVLYIFLQSLVDFPLALYDYQKDTEWLSNPWINFISNISIICFIFYFGFKKAKNSFKKVFAIKGFNPFLILPIIILLPGLQFLIGFLNFEVNQLLPAPPWFWELFEKILNSHFGFWGVMFKVAILAPIVEEILFRGIIMHGLMRNYKSWYAIFLSGLLFSLFHLNPWQMTYTFFLGLFLGWLMIKTKSLPLCILAHSINNAIVLLTIEYYPTIEKHAITSLQQGEKIKLSAFLVLFGIALIILFTQKKDKKLRST